MFVYLFYREELANVSRYFLIANAGQIFFFVSNTLMVVVLRFAAEKYQTYINIIYALIFAAAVPFVTYKYGVLGFSVSVLAVNAIKFAVVAAVGFSRLKTPGAQEQVGVSDISEALHSRTVKGYAVSKCAFQLRRHHGNILLSAENITEREPYEFDVFAFAVFCYFSCVKHHLSSNSLTRAETVFLASP